MHHPLGDNYLNLTGQWLPGKKLQLAAGTYRSYERNMQRHILAALGRFGLRRPRHHHIEAFTTASSRRTSSGAGSHAGCHRVGSLVGPMRDLRAALFFLFIWFQIDPVHIVAAAGPAAGLAVLAFGGQVVSG